MTTQLRYFIGGVVGLVAGALLTAFVGSSNLSARDAALRTQDALVAQQLEVRPVVRTAPVARRVTTTARRTVAPQSTTAPGIKAKSERSWQKTAMVIGGAAAAGAGVGGIADGKKGALIGAAIGGGAGAIYEAIKRK